MGAVPGTERAGASQFRTYVLHPMVRSAWPPIPEVHGNIVAPAGERCYKAVPFAPAGHKGIVTTGPNKVGTPPDELSLREQGAPSGRVELPPARTPRSWRNAGRARNLIFAPFETQGKDFITQYRGIVKLPRTN